jgi:putative lipoic acid-binding regulatory protein
MEPERICFPTDYPIKVVARESPDLRSQLDAVFAQHFGDIAPERVATRASAQRNFVALTYTMRVESETQLTALHGDLKALPGVIMVL